MGPRAGLDATTKRKMSYLRHNWRRYIFLSIAIALSDTWKQLLVTMVRADGCGGGGCGGGGGGGVVVAVMV